MLVPRRVRDLVLPTGVFVFEIVGQRQGAGGDKRAQPSVRTPRARSCSNIEMKALERENRELRQANEILRKASAYFAQAELDRRFKP